MSLCSLPIIASFLAACAAPSVLATGYVEGEHVALAPVALAELRLLEVARGDQVVAGQTLAMQEDRDAMIALEQAKAALAQAQSQLENLQQGKRPEEIRVIEASLTSARAQLVETRRTAARYETLATRGAATEAQREDAQTALSVAEAKVAEIEADLVVAKLPARAAEIAAAEAAVRAGQASVDQAQWLLDKRKVQAPADGVISDVLRHPGEMVGPTAPVLTMLPEGAVKLRLYVPEGEIAAIHPETRLRISCDGCAPGLTARVSYIADGPEFTPPVIYSLQNRQKLVYLVEARPEGTTSLKPGQIVDATLAESAHE
ncbi:HlyD family secretion protein [Rhodobacter aestuarii]|uniref:HlyD family secretion protein n=1 Tax=Rhodobacter aestuarii TaxID=453582 RepID=A0A1N7LIZ3_9RHOB|nr:HlyD family efflux transporter periplasmic adaptor subunit [Rhodobacter aestuarii]PTV95225.1 HlyD family secretion protein [Rhodobacter aestuarii]SIS73776.1 HlyD family secretion protein [Rhodobacter aestuarii]